MKVFEENIASYYTDLVPTDALDEQDWRNSIIQNLDQPSSTAGEKSMKDLMALMARFIIEIIVEY